MLAILLIIVPAVKPDAQSCDWNSAFHHGESITYDLYFKWGVFMPRAGLAHFTVKDATHNNKKAWEYKLQFNTAGMFEKVFKMRDTLTTYFAPDNKLIFSDKRTEEGGYYLVDRITFGPDEDKNAVHSLRYGRSGVKIDTTLIVGECAYDMLAAAMYLRSIDWGKLKTKAEYPFRVVVGRDIVNASYRYTGQAIVSPNEKTKYRTHHFYIDVYDPAFEQSKEAAEVWVGDDANHIPIRVRAKLKIGAVEVYLKDADNLKHALSCRVVLTNQSQRKNF
ncbi:MAG: DUF3108 domain-containing protein [Tannerellaceae bacterium]|jgi:hypothetical protein|nr:DUF3108 domain-containing protein [Tannerellaceae bacterium]